jgi:hypothetical protein
MHRLKSLLIITLAALAVYQTGYLWFVSFTNRSVFMYFSSFFDRPVPVGFDNIVRPTRVIFGNGDGRFDIRYGVNISEADDNIREILRRGVFGGTSPAQTVWADIVASPVILYEYAFVIRSDIFSLAFNQRDNALLADRGINRFHTIAITPSGVVFFADETAWTFTLPSGEFYFPFYDINPNFYFVHDHSNVFIPRINNGWPFHPLLITNPYTNRSGEVQIDPVNSQIAHFFDNPAMRNPRMVGNVITISTTNTVVRYLPGDVLEFNCFRPIRRSDSPDFMTDFSAALAFINNDHNAAAHHFYLAQYQMRGRTHIFWFNYIIGEPESGGFPLIAPPTGWGTANEPLYFPIEVTVDHGRVTRYRKTAFVFELDKSKQLYLTQGRLNVGRNFTSGYPETQGDGGLGYPVTQGVGDFILGYPAVQGAELELFRREIR